jgi:uncharacterized membrane protein YfcA
MMPETDVLFFIAALLSEIIGTMAGFGSSTIFLPIALFFFDFRTALILVAIFHMSGNIGRIAFFRHGFDKALLFRFGIPSIIFTIIGALLVDLISQPALKLILGSFLVVYVVLSIYRPGLSLRPTGRNTLIGGSVSGFFAGLIGTGGALRSSFLTSYNLEKSAYISTAAAISLAVDLQDTGLPGKRISPAGVLLFHSAAFLNGYHRLIHREKDRIPGATGEVQDLLADLYRAGKPEVYP